MILRSTKKFFRKTFETVRSFLSGPNYQKLPKDNSTPSPFVNSYSCSNYVNAYPLDSCTDDLDRFYADFSNHWDAGKTKKRNGKKKKKAESRVNVESHEKEAQSKKDAIIDHFDGRREDRRHLSTGNASAHLEARPDPHRESRSFRDQRSCSVARKLKELEMMDASNMDHVLDIEEVLYYYSLLTCPAYVDIVDKFFMEMCAELSGATTLGSSRSLRAGQWTGRGRLCL